MNLRFLGLLGIFVTSILSGCGHPPEEQDEEFEEEQIEEELDPPPQPGPGPKQPPQKSAEEDYYDVCPSDTYVLWEENGITYTVTIEVFCEPVMDMNLGCPGP
jgi:hypothetical protein